MRANKAKKKHTCKRNEYNSVIPENANTAIKKTQTQGILEMETLGKQTVTTDAIDVLVK